MRKSSAILLACCAIASQALAQQGFKFSNPSADEQAEAAAKARKEDKVDWQLSTPCRDRIKNRKILVLVAEEANGRVSASQGQFGRHVEAINARLQGLGLK